MVAGGDYRPIYQPQSKTEDGKSTMQKRQFDFVIVGGGIAGMAVGAELAERGLSLAHRTIMRWAKRFRNAAIRPAVWKAVLSAR